MSPIVEPFNVTMPCGRASLQPLRDVPPTSQFRRRAFFARQRMLRTTTLRPISAMRSATSVETSISNVISLFSSSVGAWAPSPQQARR